MLVRWAIPVGGIEPSRVKLDHLHAVAARWVDDAHWASPKPWSLRPFTKVDGIRYVEVATLTDESKAALLSRVRAGQHVRLGTQYGEVLAGPQLISASTWKDLDRATADRSWVVDFQTPAAFRRGSRFSPWMDPGSIVTSLGARWNAVAPVRQSQIELTAREASKIWVSDLDGRNVVASIAGLTASGFVGRIRYVCDDADLAVQFDKLLRFAAFAGIGSYTTRGFGAIRLEPTWPAG